MVLFDHLVTLLLVSLDSNSVKISGNLYPESRLIASRKGVLNNIYNINLTESVTNTYACRVVVRCDWHGNVMSYASAQYLHFSILTVFPHAFNDWLKRRAKFRKSTDVSFVG